MIELESVEQGSPYAQELIRCKDCRKFLTAECLLTIIEFGTLNFIAQNDDFFCGYAERRDAE